MKFNIDLSNADFYTKKTNLVHTYLKRTGVKHPRKFLHPSLKMIDNDIHLSDKKQIHDMKKGTKLIRHAIKNNWKIIIYSDYDADGVTSNTIMYSLLKRLGAKHVKPYCPDRVTDGYGLKTAQAKRMIKQHFDLVITTDNGIASKDAVNLLRKHNIDVIITDHHNWKRNEDGSVKKTAIPKANAIIMPNCPFDKFHFDGFCGAGIAFMIASYMLGRVATEYLDLACIATVADNVPLEQEDRVIVHYGLEQIRHTPRKGLVALVNVANNVYHANIDLSTMTANNLSYTINPLLNATGRMGNTHIGNANLDRDLLLAKN